MKLRSTVFVWVLVLVVVVLGVTTGVVAFVLDRTMKSRVVEDLARSRVVALDLHAARQSLHRQECRVVAEQPRLRAVVATEDVARENIVDAVRDLAVTLRAGVMVIVDAEGRLIADSADPDAEGFSLGDRAVVANALANGDESGVWLTDNEAFQVAGCRLDFGALVVGALVIGYAIDDAFADTIARQTGGSLVVVQNSTALTKLPAGVDAVAFAPALERVRAGAGDVELAGAQYFAQLVAVPGYSGKHRVEYLLLYPTDQALAPRRALTRVLMLLLGGAVLGTLLLALVLARRLARPIDGLVKRTQAIAHGTLSPHVMDGPDEVRALGTALDRMAKEIDDSRNALADRERLARELEIAARIQTSILPRNLDAPGLEVAARMVPATEVGGDYYDVLHVDGECWIAIGDVSGHGLTAGLVMMMVQSGVANLVHSDPAASPAAVLTTLNRVAFENVHGRLETDLHMTLSLMRLDIASGKLAIAGAHMDAVWWHAATREVELVSTPGTFLAITDDISSVNVEKQWTLARGDILLLLTDGITEAADASGRAFGYEGVIEVVTAHAAGSLDTLRNAILDAVVAHASALDDDFTVVVLRYVGREEAASS